MFNTLKYVKIMEESGFSREQAESSVGVLVEVMEEKLATKQDMENLRSEIAILKLDMKHDLALSIAQLKSELTVRLGAMMVACMTIFTAIFTAIVKLT